MGTPIIVDPAQNGSDVILTLSAPFVLEIGFSEIDVSSSYLVIDTLGHTMSVSVTVPTLTLGTGKLINVPRGIASISIPVSEITTDSNFINREEILTVISGTPTELDRQFLLDKTPTDKFYQVFDRVRVENWNTNNVPEAHRKLWSSSVVSNITPVSARNMISRIHNRYSLATRPAPKRQISNKYIANI